MIKEKEAIERLRFVITESITHPNYKRVNDLAKEYKMFYTGDGLAAKLEEMYKIKIPENLIHSIIPPILKSTMAPFQKVCRSKPKVRNMDWGEGDWEAKKRELDDYISSYWNKQSVEAHIKNIQLEQLYVDPNAWVITEFMPFDATKTKAKPYPFIASSEEVIDYAFEGDELQYIIIQQELKGNKAKLSMYTGLNTIVYTEVEKGKDKDAEELNGKYYKLDIYSPKSSFVPAYRVGYIPDMQTKGQTYLSLFDSVKQFLYKQMKVDFEGDSTLAGLAFPKRSVYVDNCPEPNCIDGHTPDGSKCSMCGGTGRAKTHRTATDVREFPMPKNSDDFIDLSKLSHTDFPPVDGLKFQQEYKDKIKDQVFSFMFNAEMYSKAEITATATEKNMHRDNMNDSLYPFSQHFSRVWKESVRAIAEFTDLGKGLKLTHIMPEDFKFRTVKELMEDLKMAKDSNASATTVAAIESDIQEQLYADRPEDLKAIRIKNTFNPFFGVNEDTVRVIVATRKTTERNSVLWANLEPIFKDLESENTNPWIYDLDVKRIKELVEIKLNEYVENMPKAPVVNPINFEDED